MTDYRFEKAVIVSKVRGVYKEVNQIFAGTASPELVEKYSPVAESLQGAKELADILKANGRARGQMDLTSDETKFVLDENGVCIDVVPRTSGESEEMIEQLMIAANCAAAKAALKAEIPFLYRVHEKPQPDRVVELYELLDPAGHPLPGDQAWQPQHQGLRRGAGPGEGRPPGPAGEPAHPADHGEGPVLPPGAGPLRFGFGGVQPLYVPHPPVPGHLHPPHFKRPGGRRQQAGIDQTLQDLCPGERRGVPRKTRCGRSPGERAAEDCYMAEYMRAHLGERHVGVISGVTPKGIFVKLAEQRRGLCGPFGF